uniref:Probable protein-export membrane protein SecG n=1 Tax=Boldia erythrosiphon TaxID=74908 RepID=A0A1Y9TLX0_9RHOD|nr:preprotein translocase SecG subunit [Boldia erythrosiphon]ARO90637.1 preprotein translocase SecG subunit [Boldia erythrosiphon]
MIKLLWYLVSLSIIFIIILQNPKSEGLYRFYSENFFNTEENKKKILKSITWILIIAFMLLTTIINIADLQ